MHRGSLVGLSPQACGAFVERGLHAPQQCREGNWLFQHVDRAGLHGGTERAYLGNTPIMVGGDLIVAIDGEKVESQQILAKVMNRHRAGDTVKVTIYRGKRKMEVSVALGEARDQV